MGWSDKDLNKNSSIENRKERIKWKIIKFKLMDLEIDVTGRVYGKYLEMIISF